MNCPICKQEFESQDTDAMPFCSNRCRQIDMGRWLEESYSLPRIADPDDDEEPEDEFLRN